PHRLPARPGDRSACVPLRSVACQEQGKSVLFFKQKTAYELGLGIPAEPLFRSLDTPIIFIEARINLSRFVVTGCAAKTSATVTFPSLNLISLFAFCFNIWLNGVAS